MCTSTNRVLKNARQFRQKKSNPLVLCSPVRAKTIMIVRSYSKMQLLFYLINSELRSEVPTVKIIGRSCGTSSSHNYAIAGAFQYIIHFWLQFSDRFHRWKHNLQASAQKSKSSHTKITMLLMQCPKYQVNMFSI